VVRGDRKPECDRPRGSTPHGDPRARRLAARRWISRACGTRLRRVREDSWPHRRSRGVAGSP
jgi:hypothetical protein